MWGGGVGVYAARLQGMPWIWGGAWVSMGLDWTTDRVQPAGDLREPSWRGCLLEFFVCFGMVIVVVFGRRFG